MAVCSEGERRDKAGREMLVSVWRPPECGEGKSHHDVELLAISMRFSTPVRTGEGTEDLCVKNNF